MENDYLILFPSFSRMDHCIPAIRYLEDLKKGRRGKLKIIFIPLISQICNNLNEYVHSIFKGKFEKYDVEINNEILETDTHKKWYERWRTYLFRIIKMPKAFSKIVMVLTPDLPNGIVLGSATSALAIPNLEIIEIPGGYDLRLSEAEFKPKEKLHNQVINYPTWASTEIRNPLMTVASGPALEETLQIIKKLAEYGKDDDLTKNGVRPKDIRKKYLELNKKELKRSALTERLIKLNDCGIIIKEEDSSIRYLTIEGLNVSTILTN